MEPGGGRGNTALGSISFNRKSDLLRALSDTYQGATVLLTVKDCNKTFIERSALTVHLWAHTERNLMSVTTEDAIRPFLTHRVSPVIGGFIRESGPIPVRSQRADEHPPPTVTWHIPITSPVDVQRAQPRYMQPVLPQQQQQYDPGSQEYLPPEIQQPYHTPTTPLMVTNTRSDYKPPARLLNHPEETDWEFPGLTFALEPDGVLGSQDDWHVYGTLLSVLISEAFNARLEKYSRADKNAIDLGSSAWLWEHGGSVVVRPLSEELACQVFLKDPTTDASQGSTTETAPGGEAGGEEEEEGGRLHTLMAHVATKASHEFEVYL
ncbi:hypothetical protein ACMYSQ_012362 [Aspergillus niger]